MKTIIILKFQRQGILMSIAAVWCLFVSLARPLEAKESETALDVFRHIIGLRQIEDSLIESMEARYTYSRIPQHTTGDTEPGPYTKNVNFGRMGEKFYSSETQRNLDTSEVTTRGVAFDGRFARSRDSLAWPNIMMIGQSDEARRVSPRPPQLIEPHSMQEMYDAVAKKDLEIMSAEDVVVDGEHCIKIAFNILRTDVPGGRAEFYYTRERGYWPILFKRYATDGRLLSEVTNVKLLKLTVGGNEIFYPSQGVWRVYGDKNATVTQSLTLDEDSVKINEPIPDSKFTMTLKPDEMLYDRELGIQLVDPGKQIDLSDAEAGLVGVERHNDRARFVDEPEVSREGADARGTEVLLRPHAVQGLQHGTIGIARAFTLFALAITAAIAIIAFRKKITAREHRGQ